MDSMDVFYVETARPIISIHKYGYDLTAALNVATTKHRVECGGPNVLTILFLSLEPGMKPTNNFLGISERRSCRGRLKVEMAVSADF